MASIDWAKTTARQDEKHLCLGIGCVLYYRFDGISCFSRQMDHGMDHDHGTMDPMMAMATNDGGGHGGHGGHGGGNGGMGDMGGMHDDMMMMMQVWDEWRHDVETCSALPALLWGDSVSCRWSLLTKASKTGLWCFLCCYSQQSVKQTVELPKMWVDGDFIWCDKALLSI